MVDALYGTGFHGSLHPAGLAACALINRQRENGAFVLAVDLPSGVNTDTGEVAEGAVHADLTVTFDSYKPLHIILLSCLPQCSLQRLCILLQKLKIFCKCWIFISFIIYF